MSHSNAMQSYRHVQNNNDINASRHQLIVKLFDGLLQRLASARGHIDRREVASKGECLGSAISIIGGLRASLDHTAGGEIASNLDNLYEYCERRLLDVNKNNDVDILDEVVGLLKDIRSAWVEIPADYHEQIPVAAAG